MPQPLSGPGVGLPLPQNLFPSELFNAPYDFSTNAISLSAGEAMYVPAGHWYIDPGAVSWLQFLDPVTQTWQTVPTTRDNALLYVWSDGFTCRLFNPTGVPLSATVSAAGTGYLPATTTVTVTGGNSTWKAIVGGAIATTTVVAGGGPFGMPPLVLIPAPPAPGIPATAIAVINAGGTLTGITLINPGAGYPSPPPIAVLASQFDPNAIAGVSIAPASVTAALGPAGAVTGVLLQNSGAPAATVTLAINGNGTGATATANLGAAAANDTVHIQTGP